MEFLLGIIGQKIQVLQVLPHQDHLDGSRINTTGIVPDDIGFLYIAHALDHLFQELVQPQEFGHHIPDLIEKRMGGIGPVHLGIAIFPSSKQARFGKTVKLHPYRVGRLIKLLGQSAQVSRIVVGKELQQQLDAGFGGDEGFEQREFGIKN